MRTPLALYNLWHQGVKTLVSIGGVAFALLLVFMQLGFMGAVSHTATNTLKSLRFDVMLRGSDYLHLYEPGTIDRYWLELAANVDGVESVAPVWITIHNWRTIPTAQQADQHRFEPQYLPIAIVAFRPGDEVFDLVEVQRAVAVGRLDSQQSLIVDDSTHADYGPWQGNRFTAQDVDREVEIGGQRYAIGGLFKLGTGLAANGAIIMSERAFARLAPWGIGESASLGLLQLRADADLQEVVEQLRQRLAVSAIHASPIHSSDRSTTVDSDGVLYEATEATVVEIVTRQQALFREQERWLWETPIGLIFQLGVVLALLVGGAIVYMVLATDVANRLPEYATLLAIGYSRKYLAAIVMTQANALAAAGFVVAWGMAEMLYRVTSLVSNIPLMMTGERVMTVSVLGLAMCCASGLLALRKLWKAEPANLF